MNYKVKITGLTLIILIIGIILGALINGAIMMHRYKQFQSFLEPGGFERFMERVVRPDESQREKMREIIDKYSDQLDETRIRAEALIDSMTTELDLILTPEQKSRLEKRFSTPGRRFPHKK